MDTIRARVSALQSQEAAELEQAAHQLNQVAIVRTVAFSLTAVLNLAFLAWLYRRIVRGRRESTVVEAGETKEAFITTLSRYIAAVAVSFVAIIMLAIVMPLFAGHSPPLVLLALAAAAAAWWGGLGPGLVATALTTVIAWYIFVPPYFSFVLHDGGEALRLALTVGSGVVISVLAERTRRAAGQQRRAIERLTAEVHERRKAEDALRESEERFRLLVDGVRDYAIFTLDTEGNVVTWNAGAERLKGYRAEEILGKSFLRFYPPEAVRDGLPAYVLQVATAEGRCEIEGWRVRKDGSCFWGDVVVTPLRDKTGRLLGFAKITRDITDRKHAEEALRESEERFRTMANAIPQLAWIAKEDGYIFWYNQRWYQYTGTTPEQMEGWGWQSVHDPQELPKVLERWKSSIASGEPFNMVFPLRGSDGVFRPFLTWVMPLRNDQGQVQQWFGTNTDVSEQKRAEEALRESEGQLKASVEKLEEVLRLLDLANVLIRDMNDRISRWNAGSQRMYGFTAEEALGRVSHELLRTRFPKPLHTIQKTLYETGRWEGELIHTRADGREMTVTSEWVLFRNNVGQPTAILEVNTDISERKRAESRLLQKTAILEAINCIFQEALRSETEEELGRSCLAVAEKITASKFGFLGEINPRTNLLDDIAISDPGWDECRVDPGGKRRPPMHFKIHGIYGRVLAEGKALFTNEPGAHVDRIGTPIGHPPLTSFLGVPLLHEGRTIGMVGVGNREGGYSRDELESLETLAPVIVEAFLRKRAEIALYRLNQELDQRVRARTVELEASNKELEAFCYSVSHDLRTPLRGIDGFSQALLENYFGKFDARGQEWLNRIRAACQRMGQLIDDLLSLSRLTRAPLRHQDVDLSALAREVVAELQQAEPNRAIQIRIADGLVNNGDPSLLRPALHNLLENAWKFTARQPQPVIEFGRAMVTHDGKEQQEAYFVRDNGVGFDMAYANKLFSPFQRLHAVKDFSGTGIGLAVVQRVLYRHGGRVWANSSPDHGATFYFTLNE